MIIDFIKKLVKKENLTPAEIKSAMDEILEGRTTSAQTASFLTALRMKGETVDEITAAVQTLKEKSAHLTLQSRNVIDIVGTGGDGADTFNISTAAAFVVAAGGVKVAKHGNIAASSKSGSADILTALGANIMLNAGQNAELLDKIGLCFMFAPKFIPQMKNVGPVRKEIGVRTIFNCLGPLINPSGANFQLIGVYDKNLVETAAHVMKNLGITSGMTLYGECGLDEASIVSKTCFAKISKNKVETGEFAPEDFGLKPASLLDIKGGEPKENAEIMKNIFQSKIKGAKLDIVALNAACAFLVANKTKTIEEGLNLAFSLIKEGTVYQKLLDFIKETNEYTG